MRNKKFLSAVCAFALIISALSGCRLAKENPPDTSGDRLVGVFITREYLDLFDFESYFSDNASKLINGGEVNIDGADARYNGRVYAGLKAVTLTSGETGGTRENYEYEFEGLDGIAYFVARIEPPDGESYLATHSDGRISDSHTSLGDETRLEATVYVTADFRALDASGTNYADFSNPVTFYMNPVYQSEDGSVYLTSGSGISTSGNMGEGMMMSQSLEETHTVTENGEEAVENFSVSVSFYIMYAPEGYAVTQMDASNTPIKRDEYVPGSLPDCITPLRGCEYLIAETFSTAGDGTPVTKRALMDGSENWLPFYQAGNGGVCVGVPVEIRW